MRHLAVNSFERFVLAVAVLASLRVLPDFGSLTIKNRITRINISTKSNLVASYNKHKNRPFCPKKGFGAFMKW
jgi:hypothetical protein